MGGFTAPAGQDALCGKKTVNVLRLGFLSHQDHFFPQVCLALGPVRIKNHFPRCSTGGCGKALRQDFRFGFRIEAWVEELFQHIGLNAQQGLFLGDKPFVHHVDGCFDEGGGIHFGVPGLQAIQLSVFYGKLEVLDFTVVIFQRMSQLHEFRINIRHFPAQFTDG